MRRFFTELGAAFIMLLTLTVCHAQQLVGLPQYGVTLGGTAGDPSIVNDTSGKTILGCVVLFVAKDGGRTGIVTSYDQKGIPPGGVGFTTVHTALLAGSSGGPSPLEFQGGGFPAVEARLSAVIFDDGEVAGPDDTHMFEGLSMMRDMKVNLANILVEAHKDPTKHDTAWGQIEKFHQDSPEYRGHPAAAPGPMAYKFMFVAKHQGEAAAYEWAEHLAATPRLWRSNR